jgi:hypothetical protein
MTTDMFISGGLKFVFSIIYGLDTLVNMHVEKIQGRYETGIMIFVITCPWKGDNVETRLGAGQSGVCISGRARGFFLFSKRPDPLWGPPSFRFKQYRIRVSQE